MDSGISRVYKTCPECYQHEIRIVRTYVSGNTMDIMENESDLHKLAKDFLHPPQGFKVIWLMR